MLKNPGAEKGPHLNPRARTRHHPCRVLNKKSNCWDGDREHRPSVRPGFIPYSPSMCLDHCSGKIQAKSYAGNGVVPHVSHMVKPLKDPRLFSWWYPRSPIQDGNVNLVTSPGGVQGYNVPGGGELCGIVQQSGYSESQLVGIHQKVTGVSLHRDLENSLAMPFTGLRHCRLNY